LSIEKIRFEEKIVVNFEISPEIENFKIPNFLLHPLIENAVKYGMQTSPPPLQIEIKAEQDKDTVIIKISNTGKWVDSDRSPKNGTNVGIENVKKRLGQFFPKKHQFNISKEKNRVTILIQIKL
jgi:LytS/YehU family sensor histidine kinase